MSRGAELAVGGMLPFTTIDYPGRLAAVVFCQGCPWRCAYCHNRHLLDFTPGRVPWPAVREFLSRRRGLLEAVVFSGGEPLAQPALPQAMREVREAGFLVGLHTSGMSPKRLARVLALADWVGLDVKASRERYRELTGAHAGKAVERSIALVLASGVAHELRTTVHDAADLPAIRAALDRLGARHWKLQERRP